MSKKTDLKTKEDKKVDFIDMDVDDQVNLINEALEHQVYEALAMDGGGMDIMDIEGYDVMISYSGACGNCHISTSGTLYFIEQTLQEKVDPKIKVVVV